MELPGTVNAITVDGQPNLVSMLVEGMENLRTLRIIGEHQIQQQTQSLIQLAYTQAKNLNLVEIDNVLWTGFAVDAMMWLQQLEANLTGSISLSGNLSFDNKLALANTYGNIDDAANKLFINYTKRAINSISVNGPTYIAETGIYQYKLVCSPSTGNDVALKDGKLAINGVLMIVPKLMVLLLILQMVFYKLPNWMKVALICVIWLSVSLRKPQVLF